MSKVIVTDAYRVTVCIPVICFGFSTPEGDKKRARQLAETLRQSIRRHCDDAENIDIMAETRELCSFCKVPWETQADGQPLCCTKAVDEWDASRTELRGEGT